MLWKQGFDDFTGQRIIEGIAEPDGGGFFLPEPTVKVPLPAGHLVQGIAVDGDYIWYPEGSTGSIYKITKDGDAVISFSDPNANAGIFVKDGYVWCVSSRAIYKYDIGGNYVGSIQLPLHHAYGIAFDGTSFWITESVYVNMLYQIDKQGNIVNLIYPPGSAKRPNGPLKTPYSIVVSGTNLWVFSFGGLYKLDIAELQKLPAETTVQ